MTPVNAVAAAGQIALLVAVCAGLPRLLALRAPAVQYLFWRVLLATCLLLPILGPRRPADMVVVPAVNAAAAAGNAAAAPGPTPAPASRAPLNWLRIAAAAIAAGAAARLIWIALGILRLGRMRARARGAVVGFDDLAQTIGVDPPVLWSADVSHPVTFGAWRPVVLLPMALEAVDAAAQRAVVAHELHHVKRRDWLWVIAEEIVRSLLWFHPAVWWLISRVQLARETVVDELSILTTNERRAYLDTLLAFADDTGLVSTPAFSARRHLFHRVMLLSKEGGMSSIRIAVASCVLAVAVGAGSWGAVHAFPLQAAAQLPPPPPPPPPAPETREAYHLVATHYYEIAQRDTSLTDEQKLAAIEKGIAAEDRALAIDPGYYQAIVYKNILLRLEANLTVDASVRQRLIAEADDLRQTAIAMRGTATQAPQSTFDSRADGGRMPPPPPPPPPPTTYPAFPSYDGFAQLAQDLKPVRIGGGIKQPLKIRDVRPIYPPIAQQARVQGVVILEALIDADGGVQAARVLRSIPLLDQAALDAVRQWQYTPTLVNGAPQAVIMTVTVNFTVQ